LKLMKVSEARAEYTLNVLTSEAELSAAVSLDASSEHFELGPFQGGSPPAWLQAYARALLKSVLRTKSAEGDWPRRLTRWRAEPKT